ncbi:MAG: preprotein translocase subunit SecG [Rhizobiales bacterium]|nr:preprotein translocase subunit SecG [Hyphomicrobiales bacterium]NRB13767.1 preprotein translocase subunit SecG [Hyphomicrobiales bacterium]
METFETALWASHLIIVIALVITILLQRSEGGALGIGGGGGDAMMSGRSAGNVLTKVTTVLAILFFLTSLSLAYISKVQNSSSSILTDANGEATSAVPVSESDKAAAEKSLDNLLQQSIGGESSVPVSE